MASENPQVEEGLPQHLSPSELGTKEYWETFYDRTLSHISSKRKPGAHITPTAEYISQKAQENDDTDEEEEEVDDDDDPGTSWFSEHNAPEKVLKFLTSAKFPLSPRNTLSRSSTSTKSNQKGLNRQTTQPSILDLGTGNGSMLALLRKRGGFKGPMVGVDYSPRSVELARELQRLKIHSAYESDDYSDSDEESDAAQPPEPEGEEEDVVVADNETTTEAIPVSEEDTEIRFEEWDILGSTDPMTKEEKEAQGGKGLDWFPYEKGGFDIVLDKGTFDAVSLSDEVVNDGSKGPGGKTIQRRVCERYPGIATRLVRKGGFLVVTSCNWTEEELIRWFTGRAGEEAKDENGEDGLYVWGRVEYPKFRFGGHEGQGVCTVCFRRRGEKA
ncbi:Protein-lysine N-methyltransferase efm4 [Paecilomyces lecythidis]|uniref:Protein-lysine N-methyltransferase EFM4 n=1 Tax=Paecilomyces lecythidis TaxID=3004212 RepID=A0ABR3X753_9EURO